MNHNQEFLWIAHSFLCDSNMGDISCRSGPLFLSFNPGMGTSGNQTLAHAECFDLETKTWSSLPQSLGRSRTEFFSMDYEFQNMFEKM